MSAPRNDMLVIALPEAESKNEEKRCIIPISVKQREFDMIDRAMAKAAFESAAKQFHHCKIIITDTLQRHRYSPKEEHLVKKYGEIWCAGITEQAASAFPDEKHYDIVGWDVYKENDTDFGYYWDEIQKKYNQDPSPFRTAVIDTIKKYFNQRRGNKSEIDEGSVNYILEESAVFNLWRKKHPFYQYMLYYQGNVNGALLYLNKKKQESDHPTDNNNADFQMADDTDERFYIPELIWNNLEMFTRYTNGANFQYVMQRLDEACKRDRYNQSALIPYVHSIKKQAVKKDNLTYTKACARLFSFFLSQGGAIQDCDNRGSIMSQAEENCLAAKKTCEELLKDHLQGYEGPFKSHLRFLNLLRNPPKEAEDLCGLYGTIIFNYCSLLNYTISEKTLDERQTIAKEFSQLCIIAHKNIPWLTENHLLWLIPGTYFLSAALFLKAKDYNKALEFYMKTMNPKWGWESDWFGKVKNRINIARVFRHIASENTDKLVDSDEYLSLAKHYLKLAIKITEEANNNRVTDEYQTHTDLEFGLICLQEKNPSKALEHFLRVIHIYKPYQVHRTDSLTVLAKAYYLAARTLVRANAEDDQIVVAQNYCQEANNCNKRLYSTRHPYHKNVSLLHGKLFLPKRNQNSHSEYKVSSAPKQNKVPN